MTTLHFRAENFEATATRVYEVGDMVDWVISAPGSGTNKSVRIEHRFPAPWLCCYLTAAHGWTELLTAGRAEDCLPRAISLLYSVPGVEVTEL